MATARANLFVDILLSNGEHFAISDYNDDIILNGVEYSAAGGMIAVGKVDFGLRANESETTITISGIPSDNIDLVFDINLKGSPIRMYRAYFDVNTGELLPMTGNPFGRFKGYVTNFDLVDELDEDGNLIFMINISATSLVSLLANKVSGQRTNPIDRVRWFTGGGGGGWDGPPPPGVPGHPRDPAPFDPPPPLFPINPPPGVIPFSEFGNVSKLENFPYVFGDKNATALLNNKQQPPERGQ